MRKYRSKKESYSFYFLTQSSSMVQSNYRLNYPSISLHSMRKKNMFVYMKADPLIEKKYVSMENAQFLSLVADGWTKIKPND